MRLQPHHHRAQNASALIIVLLLISLMLAFVLANTNALYQLNREVKLLDTRQQKHWASENAHATNATNRVAAPQ